MDTDFASDFPDPRLPANDAVAERFSACYALAEDALSAATGTVGAGRDQALVETLATALERGPERFAELVRSAPSPAIARHLLRMLDRAWRRSSSRPGAALEVTLFAVPLVVIVAGGTSSTRGVLPGVLADTVALAALLREGRALGACETLALGNALVAPAALDLDRLRTWHDLRRDPSLLQQQGGIADSAFLAPAPMEVAGTTESVYLRFIVGGALHAPGVDLLADAAVGSWGMPLTRALAAELGTPGVSVLPLPRPPATPVRALVQGQIAQRDVSAQLFVSNALRRFRASVGEPTAVISAHRCPGSPGGGEVRLSLSSPFETRDAEGFRCPLYPTERVGDVVTALADLLHACRVTDLRRAEGIHPDRASGSAMPLLFKPETLADAEHTRLQ